MSISLLPFQVKASDQIRDRYISIQHDDDRPYVRRHWAVPYYQALAALTGSGKTPILADSLAQLRATMPAEPVVLWMSRAKAVVEQTLANFESGGKYSHLIDGFLVVGSLQELSASTLHDTSTPLLVLTTVGSFNRKDPQDGSLVVHRTGQDRASEAIWTLIRKRPAVDGLRRPLIIVYDEGHNLSDQQTDLLLELEPDAILVASATMRTPAKLAKLVQDLRDAGWEDRLITSVNSKDAVEAGLIKRQILLGGYASLMESTLNDMLDAFAVVDQKAIDLNAGFRPKAIYVCRTNISQEDGKPDNPHQPFVERKASPILIWRYLVDQRGIPPEDIAVYCDLTLDRRNYPPPEGFTLFSGGDEDFNSFTAGNYHHIIFNQSLQEGWDDPACCFAYIDKSMGSTIQVEQVIGRVLRQPGQRHYSDIDLNTAQFFIRIDNKQRFQEILDVVRSKIAAVCPEVRLDGYAERRDRDRTRLEPKEIRTAPEIHVETDLEPLQEAVSKIIDYRNGSIENVTGKGERLRATQVIGDGSDASVVTEVIQHSNRVMARWLLRRSIQSFYPRVAMAIDWSEARFDARVEVTSPAADNLNEVALNLTHTWLSNSHLICEEENPYRVGPVVVNPQRLESFHNALHDGYSDLNPFELQLARALDNTGLPWARNPSTGGYAIPLLDLGSTYNFYPDFLVWKNGTIFALDPKGENLICSDAGRKLLNIHSDGSKTRVVVRLITVGKWHAPSVQSSNVGYTVWHLSNAGQVKSRHVSSVEKAVDVCLTHLR